MKNVSLIIPAYKPDEKLLNTINDAINSGFNDIIVVDDGSGLEYRDLFDRAEEIAECVVLRHNINKGKGAALKTAFSFVLENRPESSGVVAADADGQHLPKDIVAVAESMEESGNIALGYRDFSQSDVPARSRFGNQTTCGVFRLFFGLKIRDTQTGLRAFPRSVLEDLLKIKGTRYEYETQMLIFMSRNNIPFNEVKIDTVYIEENSSSHFRVIRDSVRIYSVIIKYFLSSVGATVIDESLFFVFKLFPFLKVIPIPLTFTAAFLARAVSSLVNYFVNSKVVFEEKANKKTLKRYYLLVALQILVSALTVFIIEHILVVNSAAVSTVIKIIVDTVLFFFSFRIQHKWVFKTNDNNDNKKEDEKRDMKNKKSVFRWVYRGFLLLMVALTVTCLLYVRGLLKDYESKQPERRAEEAIELLKEEAKNPDKFWEKYSLPEISTEEFEKNIDVKKQYLSLFSDDNTEYILDAGVFLEDEKGFVIRNKDLVLANVLIKANGPVETKLAVFNTRNWELVSITPQLSKNEYTVTVPDDFSVTANGVVLSDKNGQKSGDDIKYTIKNVYLTPDFSIKNNNGESASYVVKNFRVLPEIYDYDLSLPKSVKVTVDGKESKGVVQEDGLLLHSVNSLKKPEIKITDIYGNVVNYEGGKLSLTKATILAYDEYKVQVEGKDIPKAAVSKGVSQEYEFLVKHVEDLPQQTEYSIAILKENAKITVLDGDGKEVKREDGKDYYDLTKSLAGTDTVPKEISNAVDVIDVAKKWSLFMSNDYSIDKLKGYMLKDSYQYEAASKYAVSVDKTFFSAHTLLDPAFTGTKAQNFVRITDDSFSVDISLVKHMRLKNGNKVDDEMNDRFYFVKKDGKWLLCGMKEVSENG